MFKKYFLATKLAKFSINIFCLPFILYLRYIILMTPLQDLYTHTIMPSPLGDIVLNAYDGVLTHLYLPTYKNYDSAKKGRYDAESFKDVIQQLEEYFAGKRQNFDIAFLLQKGTAFQKSVWQALQKIGYGETQNYSQIAHSIGNPKAVRAVGLANAHNPLCIIIPCHRVIGKNGTLTGYAGGIEAKKWLLTHEASIIST